MSKRDIGQEILDGIRDVKAYKAGIKVLRVHILKAPAPPQVIRLKIKVIAIRFCRIDGREFANHSRLGTRQTKTQRICDCLVTNCRAKTRSVYAIDINKKFIPTRLNNQKRPVFTTRRFFF